MPGNPVEDFLRMERMPHIWCPGCGIGTTVNCFAHASRGERARPEEGRHRLGHRLHRPGGRLHEARLVPHDPRPGHPLRHRAQAGQSRPEGHRVQRRRRPDRHRRQPLHPRRPAERGHDRHPHQQLHLRDDGRPGRADDARSGRRPRRRRTGTSRRRSTCPTWPSRAGRSMSPAGRPTTSGTRPRRSRTPS